MFFLFSAPFFLLALFFSSFPSLVWFWSLSRPESLPFDALSPKWQQISLGTCFNKSTRHKYILFWKVNISSQRLISYFADALPKHLQSLPFLKAGPGLSQTWMKLKYFTKCTTESAEDEFTDAAQMRNLLLKLPVKTQYKRPSLRLESFLMSNYSKSTDIKQLDKLSFWDNFYVVADDTGWTDVESGFDSIWQLYESGYLYCTRLILTAWGIVKPVLEHSSWNNFGLETSIVWYKLL